MHTIQIMNRRRIFKRQTENYEYDECCDVVTVMDDPTDLTEFNQNLGTSRGVSSIGVRNTKNLYEKTDVIVRKILADTGNRYRVLIP
jgi:hypothetical protein